MHGALASHCEGRGSHVDRCGLDFWRCFLDMRRRVRASDRDVSSGCSLFVLKLRLEIQPFWTHIVRMPSPTEQS